MQCEQQENEGVLMETEKEKEMEEPAQTDSHTEDASAMITEEQQKSVEEKPAETESDAPECLDQVKSVKCNE